MVLYDATDMQAFLNNMEINTVNPCASCQMHLVWKYTFIAVLKILSFNLTDHVPPLNDVLMVTTNEGVKKYKLKGVLYFNAGHFTCRYIVKCGIIWFMMESCHRARSSYVKVVSCQFLAIFVHEVI